MRRIYDALRHVKGNGFPVILAPRGDPSGSASAELGVQAVVPGSLAGIMLRKHLLVLLSGRSIETVRCVQGHFHSYAVILQYEYVPNSCKD